MLALTMPPRDNWKVNWSWWRIFSLLGATPIAGRTFTKAEDEARDTHALAVISHAFLHRQFGG